MFWVLPDVSIFLIQIIRFNYITRKDCCVLPVFELLIKYVFNFQNCLALEWAITLGSWKYRKASSIFGPLRFSKTHTKINFYNRFPFDTLPYVVYDVNTDLNSLVSSDDGIFVRVHISREWTQSYSKSLRYSENACKLVCVCLCTLQRQSNSFL